MHRMSHGPRPRTAPSFCLLPIPSTFAGTTTALCRSSRFGRGFLWTRAALLQPGGCCSLRPRPHATGFAAGAAAAPAAAMTSARSARPIHAPSVAHPDSYSRPKTKNSPPRGGVLRSEEEFANVPAGGDRPQRLSTRATTRDSPNTNLAARSRTMPGRGLGSTSKVHAAATQGRPGLLRPIPGLHWPVLATTLRHCWPPSAGDTLDPSAFIPRGS